MDIAPLEPAVAIVAGAHSIAGVTWRYLDIRNAGSARDSEPAPYFRGIRVIYSDSAVCGSSALALTVCARAVDRSAAIDDNAFGPNRQLEREGIRMRMAGQIVGPNRRTIEDGD